MKACPSYRFALSRDAKRKGVALIFVLAMLVLLVGVVLAFFSQAANLRKTRSTMTASTTSGFLTDVAVNTILNDFKLEIEAGSEPVVIGGKNVGYRPLLTDKPSGTDNQNFTIAPSIVPQESGVDRDELPNVVKISRVNTAFFPVGTGNGSGNGFQTGVVGPSRASAISTNATSRNGRYLPTSETFWNKPGLMTANETASFLQSPPNWIYLDRSGNTPASLTGNLSSRAIDNDEQVVGRFAYVVYDVGGLLDANVAGNGLSDNSTAGTDNSRRGRLHQVDPTGIVPGIEDFTAFANWRWGSAKSTDDEKNANFLNDAKNTSLSAANGTQTLLGRQDLVQAAKILPGISEEATPYLTTFTRTVDAPHYRPDPDRPRILTAANDATVAADPKVSFNGTVLLPEPVAANQEDQLNPDLLGQAVIFTQQTVLARGADPDITVPAGTPVMPRRFPLTKLDLLSLPNPSQAEKDSIKYYFGLERKSVAYPWGSQDVWEYDQTKQSATGGIKRLADVAAGTPGDPAREPNFFEVLQAAIHTGSLGKYANANFVFGPPRDYLRYLQILQIGANVIDQWDADDIPTTIRFPVGSDSKEVDGQENLPYIYQMAQRLNRPKYNRDLIQAWMVFSLWNPTQNAGTAPAIQNFRIIPTKGTFYYLQIAYSSDPNWSPLASTVIPFIDTRSDRLLALNRGQDNDPSKDEIPRELSFTGGNYSNFSEPRIVNNTEPQTLEDTPGVLLLQENLSDDLGNGTPPSNAAIDEQLNKRIPATQLKLNEWVDAAPDRQWASGNKTGVTPAGEWIYEKTASPKADASEWWNWTETATEYIISAKYAAKEHNFLRHLNAGNVKVVQPADGGPNSGASSPVDPTKALSFVLQGQMPGGDWVTIQRVDDFFLDPYSAGGQLQLRNVPNVDPINGTYIKTATHHSGFSNPEVDIPALTTTPGTRNPGSFYEWRNYITTQTRPDPRTQRFGFYDTTGTPGFGRHFVDPMTTAKWNGLNSASAYMHWRGTATRYGFKSYTAASQQSPAGFTTNNPDLPAPDGFHTIIYPDRDGVVRPADAYYGGENSIVPVAPGRIEDRQIILNRPFRSVGDLGYVFRDVPWKTMDFFSRFSGDLGLLDVFSLEEPEGGTPVVGGKVDLNTRRPEVLQAVLSGSSQRLGDINSAVTARTITPTLAATLAEAVADESKINSFTYTGDLVPRVFGKDPPAGPGPSADDVLKDVKHKTEREAAVRTLSAFGNLRTWNVLIDLVFQTGHFPPGVTDPAAFVVTAQNRCWTHVAIDRMTGAIVDMQREVVNE